MVGRPSNTGLKSSDENAHAKVRRSKLVSTGSHVINISAMGCTKTMSDKE